MATVETKYQYLERNPKSNYKQLFVKGRRIRALALYRAHVSIEEPRTIEEVAADFDVAVEVVKEAVAYCESDPSEIREDFAREEALMEAYGMNDPSYKHNPTLRNVSEQEIARIRREVEARFRREVEIHGA